MAELGEPIPGLGAIDAASTAKRSVLRTIGQAWGGEGKANSNTNNEKQSCTNRSKPNSRRKSKTSVWLVSSQLERIAIE